ncbi:hypothetical protein [Pseudonocardia sp. TRM90224]|uniref:hypothetical protein n=1 Tax=Pseudonocardia sp. TRM90224 TaxID=2812678 RepID=UPI001E492899|nr:hypothetical protein [Pseudonocardia sp. TRM90224]
MHADEDRSPTDRPDGQALPCGFPGGCPNTVAYTGTGRRPKYCGQLVGGVVHIRSNAHRASKGQLTVLHAPPTVDEPTATESASRPVSTARTTLEALHRELLTTATTHQNALTGLVGRIEAAVAAVSDADAVATEIAAVHRDARRRIDDAEAATDAANNRARAAETATGAAQAERDSAIARAEQAQRDTEAAHELTRAATAARDDAVAATERLTGDLTALTTAYETTTTRLDTALDERDELQRRLTAAQGDLERIDAQLATATDQVATLTDTQQQLRAQLAGHRDEIVVERHRAELAEQQRGHAEQAAEAARQELARQLQRDETERQRLTAERDTARAEAIAAATATEQSRREAGAEIAELRAQLDGARTSLADHVAHAEQRLADQRAAYEAHIRSLLTTRPVDPQPDPQPGSQPTPSTTSPAQ